MSDLNSLHNRSVWFDIYVDDLARACQFYRAVLAIEVQVEKFGESEFAVLAHEQGNGGCLVPRPSPDHVGSAILLYLNVNGRIRDAVEQVKQNKGDVLQAIHAIGPHGYRALIKDSEGNTLALHSESDN